MLVGNSLKMCVGVGFEISLTLVAFPSYIVSTTNHMEFGRRECRNSRVIFFSFNVENANFIVFRSTAAKGVVSGIGRSALPLIPGLNVTCTSQYQYVQWAAMQITLKLSRKMST